MGPFCFAWDPLKCFCAKGIDFLLLNISFLVFIFLYSNLKSIRTEPEYDTNTKSSNIFLRKLHSVKYFLYVPPDKQI